MNISILIPTRLRSERLQPLINNIYETAHNKEGIEVLFFIESDDQPTIDAVKSAALHNERIRYIIKDSRGEGLLYSDLHNTLYTESRGSIILVGADDIKFHTPNWDDMVNECFDQYEDKILLVNPRDGIQNGNIAPHFFVHRNWVDILGYVTPTWFLSWFQDTWVTTMARNIGRYIYLPDFYLEHLHHTVGKRPRDKTSADKDRGIGRDRQIWGERQAELAVDTEKLRTFITTFPK